MIAIYKAQINAHLMIVSRHKLILRHTSATTSTKSTTYTTYTTTATERALHTEAHIDRSKEIHSEISEHQTEIVEIKKELAKHITSLKGHIHIASSTKHLIRILESMTSTHYSISHATISTQSNYTIDIPSSTAMITSARKVFKTITV